jgi:hypothetical protein
VKAPPCPARQPGMAACRRYPPVVNTRLTGVGTAVTLPVGASSPVS